MLYGLYLLGVVAATVFSWALWKSEDVAWGAYWKTHAGETVASGILAVVVFVLYEERVLGSVLELFGWTPGAAGDRLLSAELRGMLSWAAGFAGDLLARWMIAFARRRGWIPAPGQKGGGE